MDTPASTEQEQATIMIVDDMPANLQLLVRFLRDEGFRVRPVTSGFAALELAARVRPDLVLLDVNMPQMDGYEVCRRMRADRALKDVPVVFLSALGEPIDKLKAFEAGGEDYIAKPFHMEEVKARIGTHLRLARLRDDLARSYSRLKELESMRERLVHMLVHDMRSPLFGISGMLELAGMCDGVVADPHASRCIQDARESSRVLVEMISGILDVYKMESGAALVAPQETVLAEVVADAQRVLGALVRRGRFVHTALPADLKVVCDPGLTCRVLLNLIGNAVKFSPAGSEVRLDVTDEGREVRLRVQDAGPGIRSEDQARVFEKFGQLGSDSIGRKYSTGLGLVFCKMVVESQGGAIGVQSQVGHGSTFWFTIPKAANPEARSPT